MLECSIFMKALDCQTDAERSALLDEACAHDPALRERVESLLRSHALAGSFLSQPVAELLPEKLPPGNEETQPPKSEEADVLEFLAPSNSLGSVGKLGHYEVHEVIGRGGMGIVLRAFDERLHRVVAIKVMAAQLATSATARKRFNREARAAAAISHDHIVTIYAVEEANGLPYIVMHYVAGQSLQQKIDHAGHLELKEILRIGQQVAAGLAAAHAHGLMHRDVKPANILLENGVERVRITDFGLARAVDDVGITCTGEVPGTPQYMSPEQAQGLPMDARSDLFSLGCVLYAMCTGRSPFRADTNFATARRVCEDTPRPIREVNPEVPLCLVEIIDRLLAKRAAERFQSASEVAELLSQQLAEVQHPSTVGQSPKPLVKSSRRIARSRPLLWSAATVLLCAVLLLGLSEAGGVTKLTTSVIRVLTPHGTLIIEVDEPGVAVTVEGDGGLVIKGAGPREVRLPIGEYKVRATKDGQPVKEEVVSISRGGKQTVSVSRESFAPIGRGVGKTLAPRAVLKGHTKWVESFAFSPDGQTVATSSGDHHVRFWNQSTGEQTGLLLADHHNISWAAFSPDGKLLVTGSLSKNVRVWNAVTHERLAEVKHDDWVMAVAFRRRDSLLATCSRDKTVKLWKWDGAALTPVRTLEPHSAGVTAIAYSPSGDTIAAATNDGMLYLWDVESGQQLKSSRIGWYELRALAFSPDGKTIAVGGYGKHVELRSSDTLASVGTLQGHQEWVWSVAFLPDSKSLLSAGGHFSFDTISSHRPGELKLWDLATLQQRLSLEGHELGVRCVALSPDGKTLATGDFAGVARLWDVDSLLAAASPAMGDLKPKGAPQPRGPRAFALRFDGKSSHVVIPTWKFLGDDPLTIEAWLTPTLNAQPADVISNDVVEGQAGSRPGRQLFEFISNAELGGLAFGLEEQKCYFTAHDGKDYCGVAAPWPDKQQRLHVAGILDGKQIRLYVNGVEKARRSFAGKHQHSLLPLILGGNPMADGKIDYAFAGLLDYVRLSKSVRYDRDFTPAKQLAPDRDTLALYRFDEGHGETLADASGNGHHGKIIGAEWVHTDGTAIVNPAAPGAANIELRAFVLLGGPGVAERKFETLAEAVQAASDGDTIEIRGNGPFVIEPVTVNVSLVIRAGSGKRPVFTLGDTAPHGLETRAPLVLEGLELICGNTVPKEGASPALVSVTNSAPLYLSQCRLVLMGSGRAVHGNPAHCEIRHCEFIRKTGISNQAVCVSAGGPGLHLIVEGCAITGNFLAVDLPRGDRVPETCSIRFSQNTLVGGWPLALWRWGEGGAGNAPLSLDVTNNLVTGGKFYLVLADGNQVSALDSAAALEFVKRLLSYHERHNLFEPGTQPLNYFRPVGINIPLVTDVGTWQTLFGPESTLSQSGTVRFEGGSLNQRAKLDPQSVTAGDFRLRADSAGYRAGPDKKDLGADVDLVGPGAAYERWKETREYQEWLKDSRQVKDRAARKPESGAFVLIGGQGVAERKFDTLAEAVQATSDGDTIEICGDGPFISDGVTIGHPLVIRAGKDCTPTITLSQAAADKNIPLLKVSAPLVLEGLVLQRTGGALDRVEGRFPKLLEAWHEGALHVANCRLVLGLKLSQIGGSPGNLVGAKVAALTLRNCELNGNVDSASAWNYQSGNRCSIENCVIAVGGVGFIPYDGAVQDSSVRVCGSTIVGDCLYLTLQSKTNLPETTQAAPPMNLKFSGNVTHWDERIRKRGLLCFHQSRLQPPFSVEESESLLPRLVGLAEKQNVYQRGTRMLGLATDFKMVEGTRARNLSEWNQFWALQDTGSVEGVVRFQGGDLHMRGRTAPEKLSAEDFRLRPDSAGYRAGPDGKDLGADVDLVGPGAAYERWKKMPDYLEWLKETGQEK